MPKISRERKREVHLVSHQLKVQAVLRVLRGESRADVRTSIGVPESTLRGWLSQKKIIDEACDQLGGEIPSRIADMPSPIFGQFCCPDFAPDVMSLVHDRSFKEYAGSEDASSVSSSDSSSGKIDETFSRSPYHEQFRWTSDDDDDDNDGARTVISGNDNRPLKRKGITLDCIDDDLPAKRRVKEHDDTSSNGRVSCRENQQEVDELESRDCKELLHELAEKNALSRDLFVFLFETLE